MTTTPEAVQKAVADIEAGNNGWAWIGTNRALAQAVADAGYVVITARDSMGQLTYQGYTKRAQAALRAEHAAGNTTVAESTYKRPLQRLEEPDYEAAILARQERFNEGL